MEYKKYLSINLKFRQIYHYMAITMKQEIWLKGLICKNNLVKLIQKLIQF